MREREREREIERFKYRDKVSRWWKMSFCRTWPMEFEHFKSTFHAAAICFTAKMIQIDKIRLKIVNIIAWVNISQNASTKHRNMWLLHFKLLSKQRKSISFWPNAPRLIVSISTEMWWHTKQTRAHERLKAICNKKRTKIKLLNTIKSQLLEAIKKATIQTSNSSSFASR